jgi:hypothetical protein
MPVRAPDTEVVRTPGLIVHRLGCPPLVRAQFRAGGGYFEDKDEQYTDRINWLSFILYGDPHLTPGDLFPALKK